MKAGKMTKTKVYTLLAAVLLGVCLGVVCTVGYLGNVPVPSIQEQLLEKLPCQVKLVYGLNDGSPEIEAAISSVKSMAMSAGWTVDVLRKEGGPDGDQYVIIYGEVCQGG